MFIWFLHNTTMINSNPSTACNNNTKSANKVEQNNSNENARAAVKATEIVDWLGTLPLSKPVHNPPERDLSDAGLLTCLFGRCPKCGTTFVDSIIPFLSACCRNHCAFSASLCHTQHICARPFVGVEEIQLGNIGQVCVKEI